MSLCVYLYVFVAVRALVRVQHRPDSTEDKPAVNMLTLLATPLRLETVRAPLSESSCVLPVTSSSAPALLLFTFNSATLFLQFALSFGVLCSLLRC